MAAVSPTGTTGAIGGSSSAPTTWTTDLFAAAVLEQLGAPLTGNNIANMTAWIRAEAQGNLFSNGSTGNWLRDNNPLNINSTFDGATPVSHPGWGPNGSAVTVYTYTDPLAGAQATADFISKNTPGVAQALKSNAPSDLLGAAIHASGWASGGYNGANPVAGGGWLVDSNGATSTPVDLTSFSGWIKKNILHGLTPTNQGPGAIDNSVGNAITAPLQGLQAIGSFFSDLTDPTKLKRVGIFLGGAALMTVGLVVFFASTDTGKKTISTAATAALL